MAAIFFDLTSATTHRFLANQNVRSIHVVLQNVLHYNRSDTSRLQNEKNDEIQFPWRSVSFPKCMLSLKWPNKKKEKKKLIYDFYN